MYNTILYNSYFCNKNYPYQKLFEQSVYKIRNDKNSFTITGYTITINYYVSIKSTIYIMT